MLLAKLLRLLAACLLALFALSANARLMDDLQNQNTLLEKIELLPLDGPRAWLAQAVDSPEENACFYGAFVSGPTHYNYFRSYQAGQGRYTQGDPIGLAGGLNRFGYANSNPMKYSDPTGLIIGIDDLVIGGGILVVGCAMSPGCSSAVTNAVSSTVDALKSMCTPGDSDPCKGLRRQVEEHERKLRECMANPMAADNKGFLTGALAGGNQNLYDQIFASRVASLQWQIANFKKQLEKCERKNGR